MNREILIAGKVIDYVTEGQAELIRNKAIETILTQSGIEVDVDFITFS